MLAVPPVLPTRAVLIVTLTVTVSAVLLVVCAETVYLILGFADVLVLVKSVPLVVGAVTVTYESTAIAKSPPIEISLVFEPLS